MRKFFILVLLFLTFFIFPSEAGEITMEESRTVGLLRFLYCISGTGRASSAMEEVYIQKRGGNEKDKIYIEKFKDIFSTLPEHISLYPAKKFDGVGLPEKYKTTNLFYYYGSVAKDIKDFKFLLSAIVPDEKLSDLIEVIDYFLPVYDELYYGKSEKDLKEILEKRNKDKEFYNKILDRSARFYASSLSDTEIKVILVPIYVSCEDRIKYRNSNISIEAQSLGNLQIVETIIPNKDKSDEEWFISVHEIVHYYQDLSESNESLQEEMIKYDPLFGSISSAYLDEAIATIIQSYSAVLSGKEKIFREEWYNDKIIDSYGKALYPEVTDYLEKDKTIDKDLVIKGVEIFKKTFPHAPRMKEIVFNKMNIMADTYDIMEIMPLFRVIGRSRSIYGNEPLNGKEILKNYEKNCTQVFVLKENEIERLAPYVLIDKEKIREVARKNKNFSFNFFDEKRNIFNIVFICENSEKLKELLIKLKEKELVSEGIEIL